MTMSDRGGQTLKTGKIGRVNCVRQQILMPGENMDIRIKGKVKLESLRERDTLRINAHLATFMTPLRWLFPNFPDYLKEGPDSATSIPTVSRRDWAQYGIGHEDATARAMYAHWENSVLRIYNEWYKWPEDADATVWDADGNKAVPMSAPFSRIRDTIDPADSDDYTLASATNFDVRDLAQTQGKFKSAMKRDVLSFNRYMELVQEAWGGDASREVDQVPMLIDMQEVGVNPREIPATDGASLGQWQSFFDFEVDHSIDGVTAPEHCILTYMLLVRFPPIIEGIHPLARDAAHSWAEFVGDPDILAHSKPDQVESRDIHLGGASSALGYLPAGWQWRAGHDVVGNRVDVLDSFPYMNSPTTTAHCRDATRVKDAFRSATLGDYVVDLYFTENSRNRINTSMESYFVGMQGGGNDAEFPKSGKML